MEDLNVLIKQSFGEKLKSYRVLAGYSRAKLAEELKVSAKTIQSWETGRTFPENMSLIPIIEQKLAFFIPDVLGKTVREEMNKINKAKEAGKADVVRKASLEDSEALDTESKDSELKSEKPTE